MSESGHNSDEDSILMNPDFTYSDVCRDENGCIDPPQSRTIKNSKIPDGRLLKASIIPPAR